MVVKPQMDSASPSRSRLGITPMSATRRGSYHRNNPIEPIIFDTDHEAIKRHGQDQKHQCLRRTEGTCGLSAGYV